MLDNKYLMENEDEALRLDIKTDAGIIERQALWAGIKPGMRVADIGCGPGKITALMHKLAQPGGGAVGIDYSEKRIAYAQEHYGATGIEFKARNIVEPLDDLGQFDFIWARFVLEYYLSNSFDVVKNIFRILKPGGILCLIDLDYNCLSHYGMPPRLERTLFNLMKHLEMRANFDPYIGRKLYSFLYDLGFRDIDVAVEAHSVIFGELKEIDAFDWFKKIEMTRRINYAFDEYKGGYEEFVEEFRRFITDARRFTYTPVIACRGRKPA